LELLSPPPNPLPPPARCSARLPEPQLLPEPFYETDPVQPIEFHVLRLGEVALATFPFELHLDYGIRIQARSLACRRSSCSSPGAPAVICLRRARCPSAATAPTNTASAPKAGRRSSRSGRAFRKIPPILIHATLLRLHEDAATVDHHQSVRFTWLSGAPGR
jgi:hypothetical protein